MSIACDLPAVQAPSYVGLRSLAASVAYVAKPARDQLKEQPERQLLSVRQAASQLSVHENTIRNWIDRGILRAVSLPGSGFRRVVASDVVRIRQGIMGNLAHPETGPSFELPREARWHIRHEDDV